MKRLTSKAAKEFKKSQFDDLVRKISHLAVSLRILEAQANEAGIFLCERELLECKCGFMEARKIITYALFVNRELKRELLGGDLVVE